mgnify:CR=1 FL=1
MMLYVFFAIHEVYEEVSKQRRITDCICARMLRITARPTFRTKSIKKPSITINHLLTALFNFFCGCSEVNSHLYQSTDCTSRPRERTHRQVFYIGQQTALYRHAISDKVHKNKADACLIITSFPNASITVAVKAPHFRQRTLI